MTNNNNFISVYNMMIEKRNRKDSLTNILIPKDGHDIKDVYNVFNL